MKAIALEDLYVNNDGLVTTLIHVIDEATGDDRLDLLQAISTRPNEVVQPLELSYWRTTAPEGYVFVRATKDSVYGSPTTAVANSGTTIAYTTPSDPKQISHYYVHIRKPGIDPAAYQKVLDTHIWGVPRAMDDTNVIHTVVHVIDDKTGQERPELLQTIMSFPNSVVGPILLTYARVTSKEGAVFVKATKDAPDGPMTAVVSYDGLTLSLTSRTSNEDANYYVHIKHPDLSVTKEA